MSSQSPHHAKRFQRAGWRLALWYLFLGFCWTVTALAGVAFVIAWFPLTSWTSEKVEFITLTVILTLSMFSSSISIRNWIRRTRTNFVVVSDEGLTLCLPGTGEVTLPWSAISGVSYEKRWQTVKTYYGPFASRQDVYTILTASASYSYNGLDIPRPRSAARAIAQHTGGVVRNIGATPRNSVHS